MDVKSVANGIWDFFRDASKWFPINLYESLDWNEDFYLEDINFIPLYVRRHIENDFYTKMFAQLYPDPEVEESPFDKKKEESVMEKAVNGLSNAAGSAVNRVSNAVANQITATGNYARNLVSTLTFGMVGGQNAAAKGSNMSVKVLQRHIPHLKITEIRLNDVLTQKGILLDCLKKMGKAGYNLATGDAGWGDIAKKLSGAFDAALDAVMQAVLHMDAKTWLSKMTAGYYVDNLSTRIGGVAYAFIRNAASGSFMNTYELPCNGSDRIFLKSVGADGFQTESTQSQMLGMVNEFIGGNLTVNENISWKAGTFSVGPFSGSCTLFNDTLQMYLDNLRLILRLVSHSMPIRDSFMYRPPCCYDVTEVGARRCYFCKGDFTVKKLGKIRCIQWTDGESGVASVASDLINKMRTELVNSPIGDEINPDMLNYVPDAFELSYTFTPLISENYNTFVYYFLQGDDGNPNRSVLPAYGKDSYGNESRSTTSTEYGSEINLLSDEIMKKFTDAFTGAL